eukprot:scaffold58625_cov59-Phaeocystis_antarctica.AAC.6
MSDIVYLTSCSLLASRMPDFSTAVPIWALQPRYSPSGPSAFTICLTICGRDPASPCAACACWVIFSRTSG